VEIAGEPLLAHCFRALEQIAPSEVILVIRAGQRGIRERFGDHWGETPLAYAWQEEADGLAGALLAAEPLIRGPFAVLYGDNVVRADLVTPTRLFRESDLDALVLTKAVPAEEASQGVCITDDEGGLVRLIEYPNRQQREAGLVMTGFALFSPAIFDACRAVKLSSRGEREITDAINELLSSGASVKAMSLDGDRVNVNTPEDLARAERLLQS